MGFNMDVTIDVSFSSITSQSMLAVYINELQTLTSQKRLSLYIDENTADINYNNLYNFILDYGTSTAPGSSNTVGQQTSNDSDIIYSTGYIREISFNNFNLERNDLTIPFKAYIMVPSYLGIIFQLAIDNTTNITLPANSSVKLVLASESCALFDSQRAANLERLQQLNLLEGRDTISCEPSNLTEQEKEELQLQKYFKTFEQNNQLTQSKDYSLLMRNGYKYRRVCRFNK